MVGICGIVGGAEHGIDPLAAELSTHGEERAVVFRGDDVSVAVSAHPRFHEDQPATAADGSLVWVHGDPYGFEGDDGYEPRTDFSTADAAYCAELYDDHGMDFVAGLNGEFAGLVVDRERDEAALFTDRTGSHPLFYLRSDGSVLFSTFVQSLGLYPGVAPSFDRESLAEFFAVHKAFGTATPLAGARKVPPAAVVTVGLDGSVGDPRTYWRPEYRPVDRSPAELADAVVDTTRRVFDERVRDDLAYGVLLSGGSDSRFVLGSMTERGRSPRTFHVANWMSREARTAERVALTAGVDFELLRRDADYHERLLDVVPGFSNYVGAFDESFASGFADELASVDVLLTGYLGDTMFGTFPLYVPKPSVPVLYHFEDRPGSPAEYVDMYLDRYADAAVVPDFLDAPAVADVMRANVERRGEAVRYHGVEYPSLRALQLCEYYPLTNQFASANTSSLRQITGHWSPFFDNRLLDLHLTIPVRDRIRYSPVDHAVTRLAPSLAEIEHATTRVPLDESTHLSPSFLWAAAKGILRRRLDTERSPLPYADHEPWMNEDELIRHHGFLGEALDRNADLIAALPFLDRDEIDRCYRDHLDGEDNWWHLYALVTFLETPLARRVGEEHAEPSRSGDSAATSR